MTTTKSGAQPGDILTFAIQAPEEVQGKPGAPERIGDYLVHPVAAMFPLLEGEAFEKFKINIQQRGQFEPIVLQDGVLLDGRNRLRACLELDIEPKVREFGDADVRAITRFIVSSNIYRRHLTHDQQVMIGSKAVHWLVAEQNHSRQIAGVKEGGRGHTKTRSRNQDQVSGSESQARHARSTEGQIAEAAKTTRYKAAQAVRIMTQGPPGLVEQVETGKLTLRAAAKQLPRRRKSQDAPSAGKTVKRAAQTLKRLLTPFSDSQRLRLFDQISLEVKQWLG